MARREDFSLFPMVARSYWGQPVNGALPRAEAAGGCDSEEEGERYVQPHYDREQ